VARDTKPVTLSLDELRSRFEQWRRTRQGRARIPDELWAAAVTLARRDGVNSTATALPHGRRTFVKVTPSFPEPCRFVLETLGEVYKYDEQARVERLERKIVFGSTRSTARW
jgi:hypothetical protein